jgi:hypothetical protein
MAGTAWAETGHRPAGIGMMVTWPGWPGREIMIVQPTLEPLCWDAIAFPVHQLVPATRSAHEGLVAPV